jgi:hypothetical protein
MAQSGYTPIQIYYSTTAAATPTAGNLANGELAINITDGKLYYKDNGGTVRTIASKATGTIGGSDTQVQFNSSGSLAGSANFTWNGSTLAITGALTATADSSFTSTGALQISKGTTGQQPGSPSVGMLRYNTTTNQFEGYSGSSPAWGPLAGSTSSSISNGTSNVTVASANGSVTVATNGTTALTINTSQNSTFVGTVSSAGYSFSSSGQYLKTSAGAALIGSDDNSRTLIRPASSGGNVTFNNYANNATSVNITDSGNMSVSGSLSKGSGSFDIAHPLDATKRLRHSFTESPRYDLIYRGRVTLVDGKATVNLDADCGGSSPMTPGTFEALTRDPDIFLQNVSGWNNLRGSVSGATLFIESQTSCSDVVSWMVVAERKDAHIVDGAGGMADSNGKMILEY